MIAPPDGPGDRVVRVEPWTGPWDEDDPDANFKAAIAELAATDPLATVTNLAEAIGVPVGGVVHYVLARWATEGSRGLLEVGPSMVERLVAAVDHAEAATTDAEALARYRSLGGLIGWLASGLTQGYEPTDG